jgi:hypothetical protein
MSNIAKSPGGQIIVYRTDDGRGALRVRLEGETVWLTQSLLAELYQTTKQNISLHIQNIYDEGELPREATVKEYLTVQTEPPLDKKPQWTVDKLRDVVFVRA